MQLLQVLPYAVRGMSLLLLLPALLCKALMNAALHVRISGYIARFTSRYWH